jgi:hypothetical protein
MSVPRKRVSPWLLLGFGFVLAMLCSLPVIAIATGAVGSSPIYTLMDDVPERGDGAYVRVDDGVDRGVVKLYAWNFRLNEFPSDAPVFHPGHVTGLAISQRGIDTPSKYNLFRLDDGAAIPMEPKVRVTKIDFSFREPLAEGNYMLNMPKSGLSSDRQYLYFVVSRGVEWLPAVGSDE